MLEMATLKNILEVNFIDNPNQAYVENYQWHT